MSDLKAVQTGGVQAIVSNGFVCTAGQIRLDPATGELVG